MKEEEIVILTDKVMADLGGQLCRHLGPTLGKDKTCWIIADADAHYRIAHGEVPQRRPGDRLAFLYHRGKFRGALACDQGPDQLFELSCQALWAAK